MLLIKAYKKTERISNYECEKIVYAGVHTTAVTNNHYKVFYSAQFKGTGHILTGLL